MSVDYWKLKGAAAEFEKYWNEKNKAELERHWRLIERLAKQFPYSSLLDVGCGIGNLIAFTSLATKDNYLGIDISPPMVDRAGVLHPGYRFEVADPMEFSTQSDLVVANGFLFHQHDFFLKLHRLVGLTKTCLIFNLMVGSEGCSKRSSEGYWTRVLGTDEYMFMKKNLEKEFRLREVKFGEWGGREEYYLRCERHEGGANGCLGAVGSGTKS